MGSKVTYTKNALYTKRWIQAMQTTNRKKVILGREIVKLPNNQRYFKDIVYHTPSPYSQLTESIYCKGRPGSGKSWVVYSIAVQTFFSENRTWIIIDTKGSVSWNTEIFIKWKGKVLKSPIGEIIDNYIPNGDYLHEVLNNIPDMEVLSLCPDHKIKWKKITQFSKHLPTTKIIKIKTKSGRNVIATTSHSFIMLENGKYKSIKGKNLNIGDFIPISNKSEYINIKEKDIKKLIDIQYALRKISDKKEISKIKYQKSISINYGKKLLKNLENDYSDKIHEFREMVNGDVWWDEIISIEFTNDHSKYVYDFAVENTENFMLANGMIVHNSHIGNWRANIKHREAIYSMGGTVEIKL